MTERAQRPATPAGSDPGTPATFPRPADSTTGGGPGRARAQRPATPAGSDPGIPPMFPPPADSTTGGGPGRRRPDPGEVRAARAWLSRAVEPGDAAVHRFLCEHGPVETRRLLRAGEAPGDVLRQAAARLAEDRSDEDLAVAAGLGLRLVTPENDEWPQAALHAMEVAVARGAADQAPPQALWVRGSARVDAAVARAVAIVGARDATPYGVRVAADLAYALARRGWTIVSGGAYGIDGAAHRGALAADGMTVAVIAGGLRSPYPAGHGRLFDRIATAGLLVSEWPPDCPPQRHRFLIRNRLIAALASGTVVVEAGARSGAASTARRARELGRALMAVPGPITSAQSIGCHRLLQEEEARLVTCAEDVLEMVGALGDDLAPPPPVQARPRDRLDAVAQRVLDGLPARSTASADRIAVAAGIPVMDVLRCLPVLEIGGFVVQSDAGWRLGPAARPNGRRDRDEYTTEPP
jgi:DNA processing protein